MTQTDKAMREGARALQCQGGTPINKVSSHAFADMPGRESDPWS